MTFAWVNPGTVTFIGAILVAIGTLWGFVRQSSRSEEIAQLNRKLADKSDEVARLTQENLAAVTGGDSYCWITVTDLGDDGGLAAFVSAEGKHPVYDVRVQIANMRDFDDLRTGSPPPGLTPAQILARYRTFMRELSLRTSERYSAGFPPSPESAKCSTFIFTLGTGCGHKGSF
jgi:hypothetical protein